MIGLENMITMEQSMESWNKNFVEPMRKFKEDNPHLFEPFQIIVVDDDGTETDLCDITRPCPIDLGTGYDFTISHNPSTPNQDNS